MRPNQVSVVVVCLLLSLAREALSGEFAATHIFVTDKGVGAVAEYTGDGKFVRWLGQADPDFPSFADPFGIAFGPRGRMFVGSDTTGEMYRFTSDGIDLVRGDDGALVSSRGIAFGPRGQLYVASHGNDRVAVFNVDLQLVGTHDCPVGLGQPTAVGFGPDGRLWVGSEEAAAVYDFDTSTGEARTVIPLVGSPAGMAMTGWGLLVALPAAQIIQTGNLFDGSAGAPFQSGVPGPNDVAIMAHAFDRVLLVRGADTVVRDGFGPFGTLSFGSSELVDPVGVGVAPWRFKVLVTGRGMSDAIDSVDDPSSIPSKGVKIKEKAVLSLYPGTYGAFLALDPSGTLAADAWFGEEYFTLDGHVESYFSKSPDQSTMGTFEQYAGYGESFPTARAVITHGRKSDSYDSIVKDPQGSIQLSFSTVVLRRFFAGRLGKAKLLNK